MSSWKLEINSYCLSSFIHLDFQEFIEHHCVQDTTFIGVHEGYTEDFIHIYLYYVYRHMCIHSIYIIYIKSLLLIALQISPFFPPCLPPPGSINYCVKKEKCYLIHRYILPSQVHKSKQYQKNERCFCLLQEIHCIRKRNPWIRPELGSHGRKCSYFKVSLCFLLLIIESSRESYGN